MEKLYLHSPLKSRLLDLGEGGDGGLLFHFILSKIVHSSEAEVMQSFLTDESVYFCHKRYMLQLIFLSQAILVFGYANVC